MRYAEHDDDRFIRVRASVIEDGEARIKELEAELAKCAFHRHIEELEEDAQKFHDDMEKYKAENVRLRACLKRLEWSNHQGWPGHLACPVCHAYEVHKSDCWLAAECKALDNALPKA